MSLFFSWCPITIFRTVEINEIQAKCEAVDENSGIDKQINAMKTLQQAHSAIRLLFEKVLPIDYFVQIPPILACWKE